MKKELASVGLKLCLMMGVKIEEDLKDTVVTTEEEVKSIMDRWRNSKNNAIILYTLLTSNEMFLYVLALVTSAGHTKNKLEKNDDTSDRLSKKSKIVAMNHLLSLNENELEFLAATMLTIFEGEIQ